MIKLDTIIRYIVEQQYSHAVGIVIKTRDYIAKTVHLSEEENAQALEILKEINQKSVLLANTIKKSLLNLPNSPVRKCKSAITIEINCCPSFLNSFGELMSRTDACNC